MYYYKNTQASSLEEETVINVVISCCQKLNISIPCVTFVEETENQAEAIEHYDIQVAGLASPSKRTIYIALPAELFSMIKTTAHECWHIYEGDNNIPVSEDNANIFADRFRTEYLK